jgi:tagatose 1,6-diphosphate aldolase/sulfofructosephosphate aldolase
VGFIAGRAIWGEAVSLEGEERVSFLRETAVPRLAALRDALSRDGRSWREVAGAAPALSGARADDGTDRPL